MNEQRIEYKLLTFLESMEDEHSIFESFQGLLGVAVNIYMHSMHEGKTDPLNTFTGIIKEALKNYEKKEEIYFDTSPGDG